VICNEFEGGNPLATRNTTKREYSAPALEKGLDILELLANEPAGLSLTEIAQKLDRSVGQIFRMLFVLEQRGYLVIDPGSENYKLSFRLFKLAHTHTPIKRLSAAAGPVMRALAREMHQSLHLAAFYRGRCIVMVQEASPGPTGFNVRLGAEIQLLKSCSGHVLLAYSDDDERDRMLCEVPAAERRLVTKSELKAILARVREDGHECMDSAITYGVKDVGCPVFDFDDHVIAALTCPFLDRIDGSNPVDLERAIEMISKAAVDISASLGHLDSH
jgi:DNA-binding IclR family transcriptional regulator